MIDRFEGEYHFLSNFHPARVIYEGRMYRTSEHAFQAAKAVHKADKVLIQQQTYPRDAKRIGRQIYCREDWDDVRVPIMLEIVTIKFRDPVLRAKLLATHPHELFEGNRHGDRFWGQVNGVGENWLGRILMQVREDLQRLPSL